MEAVPSFLYNIGLSQYQQLFKDEKITLDILKEMGHKELNDIGIKPYGDRHVIIKAAKTLDIDVEKTAQEEMKTISAQAQVRSADRQDISISKEPAYTHAAHLIEKVSKLQSRSKNELNKTYLEIKALALMDTMNELKQEMKPKFGNIEEFIEDKIQDVNDSICPIFVTGEVSAGKSTFVNLLLGDSILPQSCLSCTSTICRISNSKTKSIFVTNHDDKREPLFESIDDCSEEIQKRVAKIVSKEGRNYKYVDIFWPLAFLKENIMIVDSPGIDPDDPDLTATIYKYLPNALLFIFIINPTNGGGVQSDRLLRLQDKLSEKSLKERGVSLDLNKGIFICNKWDEVHEQPEEVFCVIESKLEKGWKGFKKEQLFKLSARLEMERVKARKDTSPEYCAILQAIEKIIPAGVEEKVFRHIKYQHMFIDSVLKRLSARILYSMKSEMENKYRIEDINERITSLTTKLSAVKQTILELSETQVDQIICRIFNYLSDRNNHEGIFSWHAAKLPDPNLIDASIKVILEEIVHDSINRTMQQKIEEELQQLIKFLNDILSTEFSKLLYECQSIEHLISGEFVSTCCELNERFKFESINSFDTGTVVNVVLHSVGAGIPTAALYALGFDGWKSIATVLLPVSLLGFAAGFIAKYAITGISYRTDKIAYAKNIADIVIQRITEDKLKTIIKPEIMQIVQKYVDQYINNDIPKRMQATRTLVEHLTNGQLNAQEIAIQSYTVQKEAFAILGRIILSRMLIFEKNVLQNEDAENITVDIKEPNEVVREDWVLASSKSYRYQCDSKEGCIELAEICSLRNMREDSLFLNPIVDKSRATQLCLLEISHVCTRINHQNILKIHGIKQMPVQCLDRWHILQEVWETSLDHEVFENSIKWSQCLPYLRDSVKGLFALHQTGLIHKNVKLLNIKIKENTGKLSDGVVTQEIPLTGKIDGAPIVVAPELLRNGTCENKVDVFNIGIILWEAWYHKHSFCTGDMQMSTYDELKLAIVDGKRPVFNEPIPNENLKKLIHSCWSDDPKNRPSSEELLKIISIIED